LRMFYLLTETDENVAFTFFYNLEQIGKFKISYTDASNWSQDKNKAF